MPAWALTASATRLASASSPSWTRASATAWVFCTASGADSPGGAGGITTSGRPPSAGWGSSLWSCRPSPRLLALAMGPSPLPGMLLCFPLRRCASQRYLVRKRCAIPSGAAGGRRNQDPAADPKVKLGRRPHAPGGPSFALGPRLQPLEALVQGAEPGGDHGELLLVRQAAG